MPRKKRKKRVLKFDVFGVMWFGFAMSFVIFIAFVQVQEVRTWIWPAESAVARYEGELVSAINISYDGVIKVGTSNGLNYLRVKFCSANEVSAGEQNGLVLEVLVNGVRACSIPFGESRIFEARDGDLLETNIVSTKTGTAMISGSQLVLEIVDVSHNVKWPQKGKMLEIFEMEQELGNLLT